ncbi:hypothetical protein NQ314_004643 [Rhamnusium bicolor]|uniref:Uncharacterized protein n=1 Tax=Rhamnusium bicolor TaxID=1586634 RepID=A0AAV8ZK23_9CUCU|nr:hypothetical protein NQ314_004643 [Rhamnusium bicolor]
MVRGEESVVRHYILNTSFHGYRFIAEEGRHWTESWIAAGLLIESAWNDFQNNAISFVVETSYLDWDTNFPPVTVCETDNQKKLAEVTDRTFGDPHDYNLDEVVKEQVYFRGLSFYTLQICGPEAQSVNENCFVKNFSDYSDELYTLGEQEVPSMTTLGSDILQILPHIQYHRYIAIKEIENQPEVSKFLKEKDSCKLHTANCRQDLLKPSWANRPGLYCDCLPSCTEIELSIIRDDKKGIELDYAIVEIYLESLPTERFKRNVVRGKLDLVVSMGAATALFLGASILSFVEIIYYFSVRFLTDISRKNNKARKGRFAHSFEMTSRNAYLPKVT